MTTLTDFLLARIAEDEDAARAVPELAHNFGMGGERQDETRTHGRLIPSSMDGYPQRVSHPADGVHFSRWNPERVIADCEAKRRIIEIQTDQVRLGRADGLWGNWESMANQTLAALALPYAGHPDYREEWRP